MGYHKAEITKGTLGHASKIQEEFQEFMDANAQQNKVMELIELSDMLGAIDAYISRYNIGLDDLIVMMNATKSAFEDGTRK